MTRVGRYLFSIGGSRKRSGRGLKSVEVLNTDRPGRGWRKETRFNLPVGVTEHCAVLVKGPTGIELVVTGGKGRENRTFKFSFKLKKWYSLARMNEGRRQHSCAKAKFNGKEGVIVSGGAKGSSMNLTSVEWFDLQTGEWVNLPQLNQGRRNHAITVESGRLTVVGGMAGDNANKEYLRSKEVYTGGRWVEMVERLGEARERFSLGRLPAKYIRRNRSLGAKKKKKKSNSSIVGPRSRTS